MNYLEYILQENVLTDNVLQVPYAGFKFKGGYIAIIRENTYLNAWQDKETIKKFRSEQSLYNYLDKHYKDVDFYFEGNCLE